jgi:hypothetical protein
VKSLYHRKNKTGVPRFKGKKRVGGFGKMGWGGGNTRLASSTNVIIGKPLFRSEG